ncbi:hypothetical protein [Halarcobacter sp.]|uniref:hypothetical protein n=1 Tax=Halarcobacter sp. TaxID=2321133 RepID=UPI003AFF85D2
MKNIFIGIFIAVVAGVILEFIFPDKSISNSQVINNQQIVNQSNISTATGNNSQSISISNNIIQSK